jgi:hypothetical protein
MTGDLYINGVDAYTEYGLSFEDTALAQLLTFPQAKERVSNTSRLFDGKKVLNTNPKMDSREITIPFHIVGNDALAKYDLFNSQVLSTQELRIWSKYLPDREFYMLYVSCTSLSSYFQNGFKIMRFSLKLEEPDPTNRTLRSGDYPTP